MILFLLPSIAHLADFRDKLDFSLKTASKYALARNKTD